MCVRVCVCVCVCVCVEVCFACASGRVTNCEGDKLEGGFRQVGVGLCDPITNHY